MSGGISGGNGQISLQDFMRLYQPTAMPTVQPQAGGLAALGQPQPLQQPAQRSMGFGQAQGQGQGQGQGQQGGSLPFLGQVSQLGSSWGSGGAGQGQGGQGAQAGQGGLQGLLMNAMDRNGPNGNSNALANAVGYVPFGTGSFG